MTNGLLTLALSSPLGAGLWLSVGPQRLTLQAPDPGPTPAIRSVAPGRQAPCARPLQGWCLLKSWDVTMAGCCGQSPAGSSLRPFH